MRVLLYVEVADECLPDGESDRLVLERLRLRMQLSFDKAWPYAAMGSVLIDEIHIDASKRGPQ